MHTDFTHIDLCTPIFMGTEARELRYESDIQT
jgi:hypothetical protein